MKNYAIIMAGGDGTRLFPLSTKKKPKQFLNLYGTDCMINETIKRIEVIVPLENIFIIINKKQKELADKYIDTRIDKSNILLEPKACNTAICIGYAISYIMRKYGDGIVSVFSSDHYIPDNKEFVATIKKAIKVANQDKLVTIGIKPSSASTQFGYIKYNNDVREVSKPVISFIEKPNIEKAKEYVENGYLWNSGIFVWNIKAIFNAYKQYLPTVYKELKKLESCKTEEEWESETEMFYDTVEPISIDIGILEKANNVNVIIASFDWMDIGNIGILLELYKEKKIKGKDINNCIEINSNNIITFSEKPTKIFATIGIKDIFIIDTEDICLIAHKDELNDIKKLVEKMDRV